MVAALTAAIGAAIAAVADARPRVTAVAQATAADVRLRVMVVVAADVRLRAMAAVAAAIRRRAAVLLTAADRRTVADRRRAVAADMDGDTALDSFPA